MYSYLVDDQASGFTSRIEGRKFLDEQLLKPFISEGDSEMPGTMSRQEYELERMEQLRESWGRDEAAQSQWSRQG